MSVLQSRFLALLPVGLLVLGVAVQGYRIVSVNTSPWGGGPAFAMFSRVDHDSTRFVRVFHVADDGSTSAVEGIEDLEEVRLLKLHPTDGWAERLAEAVNALSAVEVGSIRIELWTVQLESTDRTVARELEAWEFNS